MKPETKRAVAQQLGKRGWAYAAQVINEFFEALETTPEYQAMAANDARYRYWRDSVWFDDEIPEKMMLAETPQDFDAAIDAARNG